ncbi:hypothetical protein [Algoriphagus zhangzhouensis]|uniref:Uncharacterized protein n=1 Tax=Algoriphagus zhangzhouensis TaxID=1073327 RepID=A0A1M7Z9N4_9BACT|nr:hypothetical protein [Algoriphagus zhangzhouensis]TDY47331.1 hypothetical protein A8938_1785 [Algoriphagus zhangzhouensis]SHO61643.1 hypothetical protein SAMN04488108_1477 [Algoriphagus zhangzhouensis]
MGLFDFPRIHFSGKIDINVPTINNSYYFPLTIYDQKKSVPFLPPRLYFSKPSIPQNVKSKLDPKPEIIHDEDNGYWYIEIKPIDTIPVLRKWCRTPLGKDKKAPDAEYVPYYVAADNDLGNLEGAVLIGNPPGYWNMYGDMSVKMYETSVVGVQTFQGGNVSTWTEDNPSQTQEITDLLDCAFNLDTHPTSGISTAVIAETISSQSIYANIFCSSVNLFNKNDTDQIHFQGKPFRFSALIYGSWRVVNWLPAMAGSARWCSSIPLESIPEAKKNKLLQFFKSQNGDDPRPIKGVFVSFTTFEVFENRYNPKLYEPNGLITNPAQATTVGTLSPWYEEDMKSIVSGRNLIALGCDAIYTNTGMGNDIPIQMTPAIASLKKLSEGLAVFSLDMGNSWPEIMTPGFINNKVQPAKRGDATFETLDLGKISLRTGTDPSTEFASIDIDPTSNPLKKVFEKGCVFDFVLTDSGQIDSIEDEFIYVYLINGDSEKLILKESTYMILTDEKGLYGQEGDDPEEGYISYNDTKEPFRLRIFQKGKPVKDPIEVYIAEYIVPEAANDPLNGPDNVTIQKVADQGIVSLATNSIRLKNTAVYYFVYKGQYPNDVIPTFSNGNYTIMDTGSFACLRVYPNKDFEKYINPNHPEYTPPSFEVMYEEVFKLYDVVYPIMAEIHPFKKEVWDNGIMAGLVKQRTDPSLWNDVLYMPRSRELGRSQRELIKAWAKRFD